MISKTKLQERITVKRKPDVVATLLACKKNGSEQWMRVGQLLSLGRNKRICANITHLSKYDKGTVVVPGKVLSDGDAHALKGISVAALSFSKGASLKLQEAKIPMLNIQEAMSKDKDGKSIQIYGGRYESH